MSTAFKAVADRIMAALLVVPALADGRVYANRLRPLPVGVNTAIVLRLEQSAARETVLGAHDWDSAYMLECYARGTVGTDPAAAVDVLLASAWARLASLSAADLGAMAIAINPVIDWQYEEADTPMVCASIRLQVQHRTPVATLESWS